MTRVGVARRQIDVNNLVRPVVGLNHGLDAGRGVLISVASARMASVPVL